MDNLERLYDYFRASILCLSILNVVTGIASFVLSGWYSTYNLFNVPTFINGLIGVAGVVATMFEINKNFLTVWIWGFELVCGVSFVCTAIGLGLSASHVQSNPIFGVPVATNGLGLLVSLTAAIIAGVLYYRIWKVESDAAPIVTRPVEDTVPLLKRTTVVQKAKPANVVRITEEL